MTADLHVTISTETSHSTFTAEKATNGESFVVVRIDGMNLFFTKRAHNQLGDLRRTLHDASVFLATQDK